jgi:hypothetical protein
MWSGGDPELFYRRLSLELPVNLNLFVQRTYFIRTIQHYNLLHTDVAVFNSDMAPLV